MTTKTEASPQPDRKRPEGIQGSDYEWCEKHDQRMHWKDGSEAWFCSACNDEVDRLRSVGASQPPEDTASELEDVRQAYRRLKGNVLAALGHTKTWDITVINEEQIEREICRLVARVGASGTPSEPVTIDLVAALKTSLAGGDAAAINKAAVSPASGTTPDARQEVAAELETIARTRSGVPGDVRERLKDLARALLGTTPEPADPPDGYDTLVRARKDMAWRVGAAAREDDGEAVEIFVNLVNAIDAALKFHDARNLRRVPPSETERTT